jgi:hypothetical protein
MPFGDFVKRAGRGGVKREITGVDRETAGFVKELFLVLREAIVVAGGAAVLERGAGFLNGKSLLVVRAQRAFLIGEVIRAGVLHRYGAKSRLAD